MFGLGIALVPPLLVTIALRLRQISPDNATTNLGLVLGVGAVCAFIANPLAGRISDRTTSRFGMRKPWILFGAALGYVGIAMIAVAPNVGVLLVGWAIGQTGFNFALAALIAMLPDQVPTSRRGRVASFISLGQNITLVAGTFLVQLFPAGLAQGLVPSAVGILILLAVIAPVRDRRLEHRPTEPFGIRQLFGSFVFDPRRHPDLGWAWLTRFCLFVSQFTATTYLPYFLIDRIGVQESQTATVVFQATLVNGVGLILTTVLGGWLSDRSQRRKPFVIGSAVVAGVGLLVLATSTDLTTMFVGQLILGAGIGAFLSVELALITDVLPSDETSGKDLGVINIAQALPQSLLPTAAPSVVAAFGYPGLFVGGALFAVLGALSITRVKNVR
nr:MFS transporter [Kineosporia babensis]